MAAQIAERAEPCLRAARAPGPRQGGIGLVVLVHPAAEVDDAPDAPGLDQRAGMGHGGIADVVVARHRVDPGARRGVRHLLRLLQRQRERLLAVDVLARRERRQRHLAVKGVGRGDGDDVHRRIGDQGAPVVRGPREAELRGHAPGALRRDVAQHRERHGRAVPEHGRRASIGQRVRLAHEARADQTQAEGHAHSALGIFVPLR